MTTTPSTSQAEGCIVLLDVPPNSSITLDGITRVTPSVQSQPQGFNRGLFIVNKIPSNIQFHLLVVRAGKESTNHQNGGGSLPVGFVLVSSVKNGNAIDGHDWIFARKYDRQTEEISNELLDEVTERNLMNAIIDESGELKKYAMSYEQFMGSDGTNNNITSWKACTTLIDGAFLSKQHDLTHGDKIVPSSDTSHEADSEMEMGNTVIDGTSIRYPNIPCIDPEINARQLTRHEGTKAYISKLDPNLRTWLLSGGVCGVTSNEECLCPEEYIWNDVLNGHYAKNSSGSSEDHFLADIQLSFLLFLYMECHSSLEHWRDAVSMSSLTIKSSRMSDNNVCLVHRPNVILQLLYSLYAQLSCIEAEFFHEAEYSSGESNFMIGAMKRICATCDALDDESEVMGKIKESSLKLQKLVGSRFHVHLFQSHGQDLADCEMDIATDFRATECGMDDMNDEDSDDDDAPVIVPSHEIEASISRSSIECSHNKKYQTISNNESQQHRLEYPLLFAAIAPHEDTVMACARILDIGNDVSLVREAAAYLEEVEAHLR